MDILPNFKMANSKKAGKTGVLRLILFVQVSHIALFKVIKETISLWVKKEEDIHLNKSVQTLQPLKTTK
jgi:hypothetical protein